MAQVEINICIVGSGMQIFISTCAFKYILILQKCPKIGQLRTLVLFLQVSKEERILSSGLNGGSPHLALSVSPWPCQRLSWSSCSSLRTRLGLYAEFISRVNTWIQEMHSNVAVIGHLQCRSYIL